MRPDEIKAAGSRRGRLAWFVTRESLVIYFVHVCVLYGSIWNIGLGQAIGPSLALLPTLTWAAVLVTAMALLAWLWHECKRWSDGLAALVRTLMAAAAAYAIV